MKTEMKAVVASVVVLALVLSAVSGIAYSWFSDSDEAKIDVTVGKVDVDLENITLKTFSNGVEQTGGSFETGGSATVSGDTITVNNIAGKDEVKVYGDIINYSSIKTIYRISIIEVDDSGEKLALNTPLFNALTAGSPTSTVWKEASIADPAGTKIEDQSLLADIGFDGYSGPVSSCHIKIVVEAYQSNADVDKSVTQTTVEGTNTFNIESTDASSELKDAVVIVEGVTGADVGKVINAGEADDSYSINGFLAGVSLVDKSAPASGLFSGLKATITMTLDGKYTEDQIMVYHKGVAFVPDSSRGESISVSLDASSDTTKVVIVTYKGFSDYQVAQKLVKVGSDYYNTVTEAIDAAANGTTVTIVGDYSVKDKFEDCTVSKKITIAGENDSVTLTNVIFMLTTDVTIKDITLLKTHTDLGTFQHPIIIPKDVDANVKLSNIDFIMDSDKEKTAGAVWSEIGTRGSLTVDGCTFSLGSDISKDVKRHALELNTLSSVSITGCTFNDISRPVNLDGVQNITASNNVFNMPAGSKDTDLNGLLKVYSINKDINSFSTSGDTINWEKVDGITMAPVFISTDVKANSFVSDKEIYIKSGCTFSIVSEISKLDLIGQDMTAIFDMYNKNFKATDSISFSNLTYKSGIVDNMGLIHTPNATFNNCIITGKMVLYSKDMLFKNCIFNQDSADFNVRTYAAGYADVDGPGKLEFDGCVFNTMGKAILIYKDGGTISQTITVSNCTFNASASAFSSNTMKNLSCAAIEIDNYMSSIDLITSKNTIHTGADAFSGEWRLKVYYDNGNDVSVNGTQYTTTVLDGKVIVLDDDKNVVSIGGKSYMDKKSFENAITSDKKDIVITLDNDVVYDTEAWSGASLGGESTETITINGNGHRLTFKNTNRDWNNVVSDVKLILNDIVLDNSGYNADSGPWNSHDIVFNCDVEMNKVTCENAVAFKKTAVLNEVTISDYKVSKDTYVVWICAGANVTINNLKF